MPGMTFASRHECRRVALLLSIAWLLGGCMTEPGRDAVAGSVAALRCPQPRDTERAPDRYQLLLNPLAPTRANLAAGRALYALEREGGSCASCHGPEGDGRGPDAASLVPPPRDFTCAATMAALTDGQLFWIIENGSGDFHRPARQGAQQVPRPGRREPATAMAGYAGELRDTQIWQLVLHVRSLAQSGDAR
jgi:mono/diheme cytochrome c family protein